MESSLEPRFIGSQAAPADSAMFACEGASAKHESRLGAAHLAHASSEPASVSIDASADHSPHIKLRTALPGQHQPSEAWGQEVDRRQELEQPAANAECVEKADNGQVEVAESAPAEDSAEKKCSQCAATKTPMWRNDIHGNKTLCNACGVRLQRQVNKAKQQAQALSEPPTSLIAGKLPRSRTSPAKLSRHELGRCESMGSLVPHGSPSRTLTLVHVHGSDGEPQLSVLPATPKRKQGGDPSLHGSASPALDLERKRLRNERRGHERALSLPVSGSLPVGGSLPWSVAPVDLLVPRLDGKRRVQNCTAKLDLPLQHGPGSGPGLLRIYLADGKEAATCGSPGSAPEPHYEPLYRAWMWDSPAHWSLMFTSQDVCTQFRGLLMRWVLHRRSESFQEQSPQARLWQEQQPSVTLAAGFRPSYKADEEDQKFVEHVNSKIRMQHRDADGGDCPAGRDPKALSTPLAQETFERLIETFEILLARTKAHQMTVGNVVLLSQKCAWAPNRAVTLAVHSYWVGKLQRLGRAACFQKAAAAFPPGGASPQGLTRSFSASPVVGSSVLGGPPLFDPTSSGLSDMSAMTLEDLALSKQRRATSETSEDTQALQGLNGEAAALPGSLGFAATATPSPLSMAQDLEMQGGPSAGGGGPKQEAFISQPVGNMFALPSWQLHGTAFANPGLPGYGDIDQNIDQNLDQDQEDLDPLDPERLARIADPHEPRLSPGDERSDQTNGMEAQKSMTPQAMDDVGIGASAVGPSCGDEAGCGTVVSRPEGVHSDGTFHHATPLDKQPANLRRVASLLEPPEVMRSTSPGTPTSGRNAAGALLYPHCSLTKHSSLDQPGQLRKHVFPRFGGSGLQHQEDLTAVERENDSFFDNVLDMQ